MAVGRTQLLLQSDNDYLQRQVAELSERLQATTFYRDFILEGGIRGATQK